MEAMCRNELFVWSSEDKDFKIDTTKAYRTTKFSHDKHWISLKLTKMLSMQYILHMFTNHFNIYTEALLDVRAYVNAAMASYDYNEPPITTSKSIIYRQLFD